MIRLPNRQVQTAAAVAAAVGMLLTACSGAPATGVRSGPTAPPASVVTTTTTAATATATPTTASAVTPTPSASSSPTTSSASGGSSTKHGCSNGRTTIPSGATTVTIGDVDRDGRRDTEFMTQTPPFRYGIRTAAGGVYTISDLPGGPGRINGWTATGFDGPLFPVTVVDDGREADLYAFVGCRFVRTLTKQGSPFVFALNGSGVQGPGTGVACTDENGGQLLARADAVKRSDGRYDVRWAVVQFLDQGRHAAYETGSSNRYTGLHAEDPPVLAANRSLCLDTPIVHTSGE